MKRNVSIGLVVVFCVALAGCSKSQPPATSPPATKEPIHEGYPLSYIQALQEQQKQLEAAAPQIGAGLQSIIALSRTWTPGSTVSVAFNGGSKELRRQISEAIRPWTEVANIHFDFGDAANGYREWTTTDTAYRADIRIAFAGSPEGGYWSMVGRDSINKTLRPPNTPSMNFEGFAEELPSDWRSVVLHEFGHAIAFEHEHQNPASTCQQEYRWNDDPGYVPTRDVYSQFIRDAQGRVPGIYTVLGGAPNWWKPEQVDFNMKRFSATPDLIFSAFDPQSIMKYHFDQKLFLNLTTSTASGCYSPRTFVLSAQDRLAASQRYPYNAGDIATVSSQRSKVAEKMKSVKTLSGELREYFRTMVQPAKGKEKKGKEDK